MKPVRRAFLTAHWRHLAMLNYETDPRILAPFVPKGTELDHWQDRTFVSVVGFMFEDVRFGRIAIPFHRTFEEVNLRFYVRRQTDDGWRRGVVFIQEIVPRWAIAWTARTFYNERYVSLPMGHAVHVAPDGTLSGAAYRWKHRGRPNSLEIRVAGEPAFVRPDSLEEFITEHYWGYAKQLDGGTLEYEVAHPRWQVWAAATAHLHCNAAALYGEHFAASLQAEPASAFLADGSPVTVYGGRRVA